MNDIQENKFNMYQATNGVLGEFEPIWTAIPAFSDITSKVTNIITDISTYHQIQIADTTGITVDKNIIRQNLIQATLKVIHGLVAHAIVIADNELLNRVNYNKSDLTLSRDTILADKAQIIHDNAAPLVTELATYLVTPTDIETLSNLIKDYTDALPEKRIAVTQSMYSTDFLREKFLEMDDLLRNKLDKLIRIFEASNPEFVSRYFAARTIIDLGVRHTTGQTIISGIVEDKATQQPIQGVNVWILEKGLSFSTGPDGRFTFDLTEGGTYTIKAEKSGYQTYTHDPVTIKKGNEAQFEIELTAI
ncbi:MAG: carboxypeptidase regulatory-like domain-containing protein [Bacteroidales bacterium]